MTAYSSNIERMRDAAYAARMAWGSVRRRFIYRRLTRLEAQAFIALGRMEQFMDDLELIRGPVNR